MCTTPVASQMVLAVGNWTTIVATGATIVRNVNGHMLLGNWKNITDQTPGYSGKSNFTIDGGTWTNNLAVTTANNIMVFSHGHNITVKNAKIKDIIRAHGIDLGGCTDVLIDNCVFEGMYFSTTLDTGMYREAVQVDLCGAGAGHSEPNDQTVCQRVTVSNCVAKTSSTPAPSGYVGGPPSVLAGHHSVANGYTLHSDIKFLDNDVQDCRLAGFHVMGMRNVLIKGNDIRRSGTYTGGTWAYTGAIRVDTYSMGGVTYSNVNVKIDDNGFGGAGIGTWVGGNNTSSITQNTGGHPI